MSAQLIAFEGLWPLPPFSAKYLTTELLPQIKGANIEVYPWYRSPTISENADKLIIVAHSWGAAAVCDRQYSADLIVTIDPRWTGLEVFKVNVEAGSRWVNYYEKDVFFNLPGCPVSGAENVLVSDGPEDTHTTICGYPPIAALINAFIAGK